MKIALEPIGVIHSPFTDPKGMPIQPVGDACLPGTVRMLPEFVDGLKDLEGFSHVILLYHFHRAQRTDLRVKPFLDSLQKGVFATRAPTRPNHIGMSVVELVKIEGAVLHLARVDILDGTPLLDIKPYVPEFDQPSEVRIGWLAAARGQASSKTSDARFI